MNREYRFHSFARRLIWICLAMFSTGNQDAVSFAQGDLSEPKLIRPSDQLEIRVRREPELSNRYSVSPSGTIDFPLIGEVQVSDREPAEVAEEIEERLTVFIRRPEVEASLAPARKMEARVSEPRPVGAIVGYTVYVSGAVQEPGAYSFQEPVTPLQLIVHAGGTDYVYGPSLTTGNSEKPGVRILPDLARVTLIGAQGEVQILDLSGIGGGNLDLEPLRSGDTVIVPGHTGGTFAIYGWVARPGVYSLDQPILLTEAMALGVPDDRFADLTHVKVLRGDPKNPEAFTVNLQRLVSRKQVELLPVIRPGDTVYVPRNLFSRLPFAPWISATARMGRPKIDSD